MSRSASWRGSRTSLNTVVPVTPKMQRHPVQHDRGGEHPHQVVLEARLVALGVALAPCREHVCGDRQRLEGDEDRDQVAARRHHHHAEHGRQQQEVVLALVVVAFGDVVGRQQHDDVAGDDEQCLHRQREVVDDVAGIAGQHEPIGSIDGERENRHHRRQQSDAGDRPEQGPVALGREVDEQHHDQAWPR